MATIGVITIEMRVDDSHSLKDKRHFVRSLKDRLRKRHNVAVAEIDYQDQWQRALLAAVTVSSSRGVAERTMELVEKDASLLLGRYLTEVSVEWLE